MTECSDLSSRKFSIRQNAKRYISKWIDFREELGAKVVGGPFYSAVGRLRPSEKIEKERERGISGLREVGDSGEERGIFVTIEDAIKEAGELLYHIQIGENDRGTPGTGSIRWDGIANGIKEIWILSLAGH